MAEIKPPPFEHGDDDVIENKKVPFRLSNKGSFNTEQYNINDRFNLSEASDKPRTTIELVKHLEKNKDVEIEAKIICKEKDGTVSTRTFNRQTFLEQWKKWGTRHQTFRESIDCFSGGFMGNGQGGYNQGDLDIGQDYVPLLSGPYYKQLYYYDYLRMHALAFQTYHHDPVAKRCIDTILQFTLGRGFSIDFADQDDQAAWAAFSEANNLDARFENIARELLMFGEQFIWWLPNRDINITYNVAPSQKSKKGVIPRFRTIDPSVIWEIVTYPEDIERVLYYQWIAPTQYQMYTGTDEGAPVPGTKFIFQQVPSDEVMHFKINCVSDEKRGRSILFPVFGDLKRLRDTIDYSIAGLQKNVAYSIDTTIKGSQQDIDTYIAAQNALGAVPPAGNEFVHTDAITREYLSNTGSKGGVSGDTFDWVLSKIAMGIGMPVSYLGGHQSGGHNRASAIVATEPVTKLFEFYQKQYDRILRAMAKKLNLKSAMQITFPELVTQDRSAKIRDIMSAERADYISKRRAASMSSKELNILDYDYDKEMEHIKSEGTVDPNLLTPTGTSPWGADTEQPALDKTDEPGQNKPSALKSDTKRQISQRDGA